MCSAHAACAPFSSPLTPCCIHPCRYHCELNPIERYWGAAKKYARRHCSYTIVGLRECVPIALSQTLEEAPQWV